MEEKIKYKLELPEGIELPEGCELPEIELGKASLRRTVIQEDGTMTEKEETLWVPRIKKEET
ncbi:hypothetical protein ACTNB0_08005 [Lachnospiraceae bacterium HCP28S3_F9]|uniref:hypothetical protein n=1 Tax=Dorea sp. YH-dor228 TaxID=3151120 RepID=UPI003242DC2F